MPTNIDSLQVDIQAKSDVAGKAISALIDTLDRLKTATSGGAGLSALAKKLEKAGQAANSVDSAAGQKVKSFADGLKSLENLGKVTFSANVYHTLEKLGEVTKRLPDDAGTRIFRLAAGLNDLKSVGDIKISTTLAPNMDALGKAAGVLAGKNFSGFRNLAQGLSALSELPNTNLSSVVRGLDNLLIAMPEINALDTAGLTNKMHELAKAVEPLSKLEKVSNFASALTQLKKLPEVMEALKSVDVADMGSKVEQLTKSLGPLASQVQIIQSGLNTLPSTVEKAAAGMGTLKNANDRAADSYVGLYAAFQMMRGALNTAGRLIAGWIDKSNQYIEDLNLFNASLGEYAGKAKAYADQVSSLMGIDPGKWMRSQGVFQTLATGFGVTSDRAYIMSKNLTQLGYDISSFFNISVDDAMQKLQSGLSGELEPLRRLGYDLSKARLEATALSLGITESFNDMTQAEKAQLRYYAIMKQVTVAQGDMARTLETPSNQLRVFKAQLEMTARSLGNIFIPALNAVLPYAIAFAQAIRMILDGISSLFGFKLPEIDYGDVSGINGATDSVDDLDDSLQGATESAKKLKGLLASWDELNIIMSESESGGTGGRGGKKGAGAAAIADAWDFELPQYDFLKDLIKTKADDIIKRWKPAIDWFMSNLKQILSVVESIGAALLLWSLSKKFFPDLSKNFALLKAIEAFALAGLTLVITAQLVYDFDKKYLDKGGIGHLIADGLTTIAGSAIAGRVVAAATNETVGAYAASATLLISAFTSLKVLYDGVKENGITDEAIGLSVWKAVKTAAAGGVIGARYAGLKGAAAGAAIGFIVDGVANLSLMYGEIVNKGKISGAAIATGVVSALEAAAGAGIVGFTIGGPAGAAIGAAIGFTVTAGIGFAISTIALAEGEAEKLKTDAKWGSVKATATELKKKAEEIFGFSVTPTITLANTTITNETEARTELETKLTSFSSDLNLIKLGIDDKTTYQNMLTTLTGGATSGAPAEGSLLANLGKTLSAMTETVKLGVSLVPPVGENGEAMDAAQMITSMGLTSSAIQKESESLGMELAKYLAKGASEGLDDKEREMVAKLSSWLSNIENGVLTGKILGGFKGTVEASLGNLDRESFNGFLDTYGSMVDDTMDQYEKLAIQTKSDLEGLSAGALALYETNLDRYGANDQRTIDALANWENARANADMYSVEKSLAGRREELEKLGREATKPALESIYSEQLSSANNPFIEFANGIIGDASWLYNWDESIDDSATILAETIEQSYYDALKKVMTGEDFATFMKAKDTLGFDWKDFIPDNIFNQLYESLKENLGENGAQKTMEELGVNTMTDFKQGITNTEGEVGLAGSEVGKTLTDKLKSANTYEAGQAVMQNFIKGMSSVTLPSVVASVAGGKFTPALTPITMAANGGFVDSGQAFIAREQGPELVGQIGRKTAVVNNEQIISGVASGVAAGQAEQNALLREQNGYLRQILGKEFTAKLVASSGVGKEVQRSLDMYARNSGRRG